MENKVDFTVIEPLKDRVLIERDPPETKIGSVEIPEAFRENQLTGTVVALGEGKLSDLGERVLPDVKVGDRVLFPKNIGTELNFEGRDFLMMREGDISSILDGKKGVKIEKKEVEN